jgi:hypothetical protein
VGLVEIAVDNLESCSAKVGENIILSQESGKSTTTASNSISGGGDKSKLWFPFAEGIPFAATLWLGAEGFHMTVNGRHISSFQYRQVLTSSPIVIPNGLKSMKIFNFTINLKDFPMYCFRSVVLGTSRIRINCFPLNILLSIRKGISSVLPVFGSSQIWKLITGGSQCGSQSFTTTVLKKRELEVL